MLCDAVRPVEVFFFGKSCAFRADQVAVFLPALVALVVCADHFLNARFQGVESAQNGQDTANGEAASY